MEQTVEQHAAVPRRQNEPIAIGPLGVSGVVPEMLLPEDVGHRGGAQGQTGMSGLRFLDRVDRQRTDRVDAKFVQGLGHRAQCRLRLPWRARAFFNALPFPFSILPASLRRGPAHPSDTTAAAGNNLITHPDYAPRARPDSVNEDVLPPLGSARESATTS